MSHRYTEGQPFNPYLYDLSDPYFLNKFRSDWARNTVEHGRGNSTRVVPFEEIADLKTGKVYSADPNYGFAEVKNAKSDPLYYGTSNLFSIFTNPDNYSNGACHIVHFSPPDKEIGFDSGRITIYTATKTSDDLVHIQGYGSIGCEQSWGEYQKFAYQLTGVWFSDPKLLRDFPLNIDTKHDNLVNHLSQKIPQLKKDWQDISSGLANDFLAQVLSESMQISESAIRRMVATGMLGIAYDSMQSAGRTANFADTQCPTGFGTLESGSFTYVDGKLKKFIKNCGACKMSLNMWMAAHDRCPFCNGEYLGC